MKKDYTYKSNRVDFVMDPETFSTFMKMAEEKGLLPATFARIIVKEYIKNNTEIN